MRIVSYLRRKKIDYFLESDGGLAKSGKGIKEKIKTHFIKGAKGYFSTSDIHDEYYLTYGAEKSRLIRYPFTSLKQKDIDVETPSRITKVELRKKLNITEEKVIISVGRFSYLNGYGKGYDVLIRSATQMGKDVGWYIIGGEPTEEFEKMRVDAGLDNVHFIKFLNKEELKEFYRAADVFVLMTVADVWGLVVNEAMACGLPVITTDKCVAGLDLVKDGENGYILPVGDDKGLKEKLEILFANEEKIKDAGKKSLEIIREYTIENMAKTHIEIFKKVLNEK